MHNSLFGGLLGRSVLDGEGMDLRSLLTQITTFINQQNQQIQALILEFRKMYNTLLVR